MIDTLFGSKTRVKLLYLFMNSPEQEFYVREITKKIDEQINSVRRELANMMEMGLIRSDSRDNKIFYRVNKGHAFYNPLHKMFTSVEVTKKEHSEEQSALAKKFFAIGDVRLVLFMGKLVNSFDSSLDLVVVGNVSKVKLKNLIHHLEDLLNITRDEINWQHYAIDDFYYRRSVGDEHVNSLLDMKYTVVVDVDDMLGDGAKEEAK
jgi:DNA-binding transcriptional ArsR family regulator